MRIVLNDKEGGKKEEDRGGGGEKEEIRGSVHKSF